VTFAPVIGKASYLRQITSTLPFRSVPVGTSLEGSCPPSVFIGSHNYPKVQAGPMIAPTGGDTAYMDTPEGWLPARRTQEEILGFRLSLVRGKHPVDALHPEGRFVESLQDIALSGSSLKSRAEFGYTPQGFSFSQENTPHGPSAPLRTLDIDASTWDRDLGKVFYDTDLAASDAMMALHAKGVAFSRIQKALSVGTMGTGRRRRLVPTRWSITAADSTIGDRLLEEVRKYEVIDEVRIHEFSSLHNHYAVILIPTPWQYEWAEAFVHVQGEEELVFADHEGMRGKKGYSTVGGCFYSCRMAVLEALEREQVQAGAIVLREATNGYIPMGVFNVRENVRNALRSDPVSQDGLKSALKQATSRMTLPLARFLDVCSLTRDVLAERQSTLSGFF
jgi:hypothetical protein